LQQGAEAAHGGFATDMSSNALLMVANNLEVLKTEHLAI
jgi:hypothetical protein